MIPAWFKSISKLLTEGCRTEAYQIKQYPRLQIPTSIISVKAKKFSCLRSGLFKQIRPCLLVFFNQLFSVSQWYTWLFFNRMCNKLCQNRIGCRQRKVWMESAAWIWVWSAEMSCWAPSRAERYPQRGWRQRCRQEGEGTTDHHTHTHTHTHADPISIHT